LSRIKDHPILRTFRGPGWVLAVALLLLPAVGSRRALALDGTEPLPWGSKPVSTHAPYTARDCTGCHTKRWGGQLLDETDHMCLACHEDARQHVHAPKNCIRCHNAHDSMRAKLLRADLEKCSECHKQKFGGIAPAPHLG